MSGFSEGVGMENAESVGGGAVTLSRRNWNSGWLVGSGSRRCLGNGRLADTCLYHWV